MSEPDSKLPSVMLTWTESLMALAPMRLWLGASKASLPGHAVMPDPSLERISTGKAGYACGRSS